MTVRVPLGWLAPGIGVVVTVAAWAAGGARDPGPRLGSDAGGPLAGLTAGQEAAFDLGADAFGEEESVGEGLGPRFNLASCGACHAQPALGGTSPAVNPQVSAATALGAQNVVPSFLSADGPIREARFKFNPDGSRDGGVHALFVIRGRLDESGDATDCDIEQEDFDRQHAKGNVSFRIPTPTFGTGLIEAIPDGVILGNAAANAGLKANLGIKGRPNQLVSGAVNRNGNDGTITRFGWKAQNKSLLIFAGEAYNVEMGISNELFPTERDETVLCHYAPTPNDETGLDGEPEHSDTQKFSFFMRFLAAPTPVTEYAGASADSVRRGRDVFTAAGCAFCHTPALMTGDSTVAALSHAPVNLYSDLLLHDMGVGLADDVKQGLAGPAEFRTAPLWGLGQRLFFLHDGRTRDLVEAIQQHASPGSEARYVIERYRRLDDRAQQDLLNFLRSL